MAGFPALDAAPQGRIRSPNPQGDTMLRRITALLAVAAFLAPAAMARANEWEEDYSDEWREDGPRPDDYPVSVDVDASASVSFDTFHGALAPYGEWVVVGGYGRVWRPHVAAGWRPYYYGRWEWTNEGWLWVSDEPWGWAAYHYGRWNHDPYYGWVWVPGYQWAPAWVSWRYSGDVVGWAPLAPGVSVYVSVTPFVDTWWTFVPCNEFVAVPVYRVAYAPTYSRRYFYAPGAPGHASRPGTHAARAGVGRAASSSHRAAHRQVDRASSSRARADPGRRPRAAGRGRDLPAGGSGPRLRRPPGGRCDRAAAGAGSAPGGACRAWRLARQSPGWHPPHVPALRAAAALHARPRFPRRRRPRRHPALAGAGSARRTGEQRGAGLDPAAGRATPGAPRWAHARSPGPPRAPGQRKRQPRTRGAPRYPRHAAASTQGPGRRRWTGRRATGG